MARSPAPGSSGETKSRKISGRFWSLLLVGVLFLLVGSYLAPGVQSHSMAPGTVAAPKSSAMFAGALRAPTPAIVRAAAGFPVIVSYVATPASISETQSTTFDVVASATSGTLPFTYIYSNLPPGCVTANTSSLSCLPTVNGTFKVQGQVRDVHGNSTFANTTLTVLPYTLGSFLEFNTSLGNPVQLNRLCTLTNASPFYTSYCYQQAQQPTVLTFSNGNIGVGFQEYTHQTSNTCTGASPATTARVEFALSSTDGVSYSSFVNLGNTTCSYLNAIEPSFVLSGGVVYGVFVEENQTSAQLPVAYSDRTGDAMGFVTATSSGTVWSAVRTLPLLGSQIAQPRLVAAGHTLYLVWERIANSTTAIGGGVLPIAVQFSASLDGGLTWSVPLTLRGLNATAGHNAMSPSIAVTPSGTLVVVYATNRSCVSSTKTGCAAYGENIVSVNSTNNGSLWGSLHVIAKGIGESTCYSSGCLSSFYQSTPETTVAAAADGSVSVAYAGTVPLNPFNPLLNYRWTALFYGASSNGGATWTTMKVHGWGFGTSTNFFNPAIGTSNGTAYLTYTEDNETLGSYWLDSSMSQWLITTPIGSNINLASPYMVEIAKLPSGRLTNYTRNSYSGLGAGIGFDDVTATPIVAFALEQTPAVRISHGPGYYYTNNTYSTNLTVAYEGPRGVSPQTVSLLFTQTGLSSAFNWSITVNGATFTTNTSQIFVPNVPRNQLLVVLQNPLAGAGWILQTSQITEQGLLVFVTNMTIALEFSLFFGYAWYPSAATWSQLSSGGGGFSFFEIENNNNTYTANGFTNIDDYFYFYHSGTFGEIFIEHYYFNYVYSPYAYQDAYSERYCTFSSLSGGGMPCTPTLAFQGSYSYNMPLLPVPSIPFPFYYAYGQSFPLTVYCEGLQSAPSYTNGTGAGEFSGGFVNDFGSCTNYGQYHTASKVRVLSVGNQTVYFGGTSSSGTYNETIQPVGLPSGTPYHFTWAGVPYSAKAPATVQIGPIGLGSYSVTNIWANGSKPGWEYFGHLDSGTRVLVPWQTIVNLTFSASVNLTSPLKSVTFNAVNLTAGVQWRLVFNETSYAASTPSITVSTRSGDFPISSGAAVGPSGDTGYVPNIPASVDLTGPATQVNLSFVPAYRVNFTASLGGTVSVGSSTPTDSFQYWAAVGQTFSFAAHPDPGFAFVTWTGTGSGSYTGTNATTTAKANAPLEEAAEFEALPGARFSLTFQESGLPAGTEWGVVLSGVGYSSNSNQLTISNLYAWSGTTAQGHYSLVVPPAYLNSTNQAKYIVSGAPSVIGTNGSATPPQTLTFLGEYAVSVVPTQGGSAKAVLGSTAGTTIWAPDGATVSLQETAVTNFHFLGWNGTGPGSYSGTLKNPNVRVTGAPIRELAVFEKNPVIPPKTYYATFSVSTPLEAGTVWSIQVAGVGYSALAGATINVTGLVAGQGPYPLLLYPMYGPAGLTEYVPAAGDPSAVQVIAGPVLVSLQYQTYYYVSITTSTGGTVSPASGWVASGSSFTLNAAPVGTNTFTHWVGTGNGSFSGKTTVGTVHVNGPITEVAEFSPAVPQAIQVTSMWTSPALLGGLAAAGLVAGLGIGLLVARSGRRPGSGGGGSA